MSLELDGIALIRHVRDPDTGATTLVNSVHNINVSEKRNIVEHKPPSLQGGLLQDLGRARAEIMVSNSSFCSSYTPSIGVNATNCSSSNGNAADGK